MQNYWYVKTYDVVRDKFDIASKRFPTRQLLFEYYKKLFHCQKLHPMQLYICKGDICKGVINIYSRLDGREDWYYTRTKAIKNNDVP